MSRRHPTQVLFDADEVRRVNRVRIAKYYGVTPGQVDAMAATDVDDTLEIMWAEAQK